MDARKDRPSREAILEIVRQKLTKDQLQRSSIYWDSRILAKDEELSIGLRSIAMPFAGTVVFVDLAPGYNWAHPCLYLLVDLNATETQTVEASFPPFTGDIPNTVVRLLG